MIQTAEHARSPWHWEKRGDGYALYSDDGSVVIDDGSAAGAFASVIDINSPNAKLIAAAPDLLAACQCALNSMGYGLTEEIAYEAHTTAIAAARGEKRLSIAPPTRGGACNRD